jgi:signal peptidase II
MPERRPGPITSTRVIPVVAIVVLLADFLSKQWALTHLHAGVVDGFVPWILDMTLVTNTGTAFGMWRSERLVGMLLPPIICLAIIYWIVRRERRGDALSAVERLGFGMLLGGALGNMFDRLTRGEVTDFLYFAFYPSFPVFNLADALIDVGVALIVCQSLFWQRQPDGRELLHQHRDRMRGNRDPQRGNRDSQPGSQDPQASSKELLPGNMDPLPGSKDPQAGSKDPLAANKEPLMANNKDPLTGSKDPLSGSKDPLHD